MIIDFAQQITKLRQSVPNMLKKNNILHKASRVAEKSSVLDHISYNYHITSYYINKDLLLSVVLMQFVITITNMYIIHVYSTQQKLCNT